MILCIDVDNLINDLTEKALIMYNSENNKNIQISDLTTYNFYDCLSKEDAEGLINLFQRKELWDSLEPLHDSQWGIKTLINQNHEMYLSTSTHHLNFSWKVDWIQRYFPFINTENIICIHNKGLLKCDVMVDDNLSNLTSNICERIVLDFPWNRSTSKDYAYNIYRCYNWLDIVDTINKIERKYKEWMEMTIMEET